MQATDGNFYGTTLAGGADDDGTVFSLTPGGLALACPSQIAEVEVAYSSALVAFGGVAPYTFSITSGALPPGLSLNTSTGAITGTPTTSGTFSFTAQVVDSQSNSATASCSIVVYGAGADPTNTFLTLAPATLPVGSSGPVVMTAAVAPISGGGTPTGSVTYFNGSNQIGTAALSGEVATFNYNPSSLAVGTYSITAVYGGDSIFAGSTSPVRTLTITSGQGFTTLADFEGLANGDTPFYGDLIQGTDGNNYGTTAGGGVYDQGTVFQVTPDGTLTTLYTFCSQANCTDGAEPFSGLVQAGGNFYGTTYWGGANGVGTVFKVTPGGQLTTLYNFCSQPGCSDGSNPVAGLVQVGGNFYGTTNDGGANGYGTVFEITPAGQFTMLHSFDYLDDGAYPEAGLVQATDGNLYGTTRDGGASGNAAGTVFKITPAGQLTTLYAFCQTDCSDGAFPYAGLIQATNGNLYGTTSNGGSTGSCFGCGTVFQITLAGQLTTLYSFCSQANCADGLAPYAGLIQASDGNSTERRRMGAPTAMERPLESRQTASCSRCIASP